MFTCLGLLNIPLLMRIYTNVKITHILVSTRSLILASPCLHKNYFFTFCFLREQLERRKLNDRKQGGVRGCTTT